MSVIVPFLNREQFLQECIQSVLDQSFQNWELMLVNDGSTDNSIQIAKQFVEAYPKKIFLFEHENQHSRGAGAARNLGIRHAEGDYISFLDSDDVLLPNAIEAGLNGFASCPQADAVCGELQVWYSWTDASEKRERDFVTNIGLASQKLYLPPALLIHNLLAGGRKPGMNCVMLKKDLIYSIGPVFEDGFLWVCEDQIFWSKVSLNARIYLIDSCLAKYRQHPDSSCNLLIKNGNEFKDWEMFLKWLENYLIEKRIESQDVWRAFNSFRTESQYQKRFRRLKAIYRRLFPLFFRYWLRDQLVKWRTRKTA